MAFYFSKLLPLATAGAWAPDLLGHILIQHGPKPKFDGLIPCIKNSILRSPFQKANISNQQKRPVF